jgi:hypothetical protein
MIISPRDYDLDTQTMAAKMPEHRRSSAADIDIQDESRLAELGYKQELRRDWSLLHNFGVSFSIIVRKISLEFLPD